MGPSPPNGATPEPANGSDRSDLLDRILTGRLLVLAPHMDDEALGCGGTILLHRNKDDVHCLFATDGAASPAPLLPWLGRTDSDLPSRRREEAKATARRLGLPPGNLEFLQLPDGQLGGNKQALERALSDAFASLSPDYVFAPFRFDVHPDHIALNRAARAVLGRMAHPPAFLEYFVYHRLRGVPGGDVRSALESDALLEVDIGSVSEAKRAALDCYVSQTTVLYPWQDRPILTQDSLRQCCEEPEYLLPTDPSAPLSAGFRAHTRRVQLATLAMRYGKRPKDRARALVRWTLGR